MSLAEVVDDVGLQPEPTEELWVQSSTDPDKQIRIRSLSVYLAQGGRITDARLVEGEDDRWTIFLRMAGRRGEYRLNVYRSDQPKTYRDVRLAIETIRAEFGWTGSIMLSTEKPPSQAHPVAEADGAEDED